MGELRCFWYQGAISLSAPLLSVDERLVRYGDGLFETVRVWQGKALWLPYHIERLAEAANFLKIYISVSEIEGAIHSLLREPGLTQGKLRICVFRKGDAGYSPTSMQSDFWIEMTNNRDRLYEFEHVSACLIKGVATALHPLSSLKSNSALHHVIAAAEASRFGCNEGIVLNDKGRISEGINSNIFICSKAGWRTPAVTEGIVPGIMRRIVMDLTEVQEVEMDIDELKNANEVIFTNAYRGIRYLETFEGKTYTWEAAARLSDQIREAAARSISSGLGR